MNTGRGRAESDAQEILIDVTVVGSRSSVRMFYDESNFADRKAVSLFFSTGDTNPLTCPVMFHGPVTFQLVRFYSTIYSFVYCTTDTLE